MVSRAASRLPAVNWKAPTAEKVPERGWPPSCRFRQLHAGVGIDFELGVGEDAFDAERRQRGTHRADEQLFRARTGDVEAGDEDVVAGADPIAGGDVDEARRVARAGIVGFDEHDSGAGAGHLGGLPAVHRAQQRGIETRRGQGEGADAGERGALRADVPPQLSLASSWPVSLKSARRGSDIVPLTPNGARPGPTARRRIDFEPPCRVKPMISVWPVAIAVRTVGQAGSRAGGRRRTRFGGTRAAIHVGRRAPDRALLPILRQRCRGRSDHDRVPAARGRRVPGGFKAETQDVNPPRFRAG